MKRRTEMVHVAFGATFTALAVTAWWLSSPQNIRRASEAIVLLIGSVGIAWAGQAIARALARHRDPAKGGTRRHSPAVIATGKG